MNGTEKRVRAVELIGWLRHQVNDKAITGRALADVFEAFLAAMDEDRAGLVDDLISAAGGAIKDGLASTNARIDKIDGAHLLKSAGAAVTSANLRALEAVASDVELRRAKLVSGTPSAFLQAVLDGDQATVKGATPDIVFRKITAQP
ncbi:hypothetical protein [Paracoccus sp. KR1-242]|uniref:hypothetical protein n=1 Tax=Paracoccus sp. KR1-242 TaxID=3410028 RepID=UPI003C0E0169